MYEIYVLNSGDTIESISKTIGIDPAVLYQINNFPPNFVPMAGQSIIVPKKQDSNFNYYTIKKGDNLYGIAQAYNVDVATLAKINGLNLTDFIYPNQTILVPRNGVKLYITSENETIADVSQKLGIPAERLLLFNKSIYLQPEQLIIYKESI